MRARSHAVFARHLSAGDRVLDLCCGTGADFSFWEDLGVQLTGLDFSAKMLAVARTKSAQAELIQMDLAELASLDRLFEGICTNFGGLNTVGELGPLSDELARLLVPGGWLMVNIMSPWPLAEILEGIFGGGHFFRRLRHPPGTPLHVGGQPVPTWYHAPARCYRRFFARHFALRDLVGLGVFLPPPSGPAREPPVWRLYLERALAARPIFNQLGDHSLLIMQRRT